MGRYRKIKRPFPPPAASTARCSPAPQDSGRTGRGMGACAGRDWPALAGRGLMHTQGGEAAELPGGLIQAYAADALPDTKALATLEAQRRGRDRRVHTLRQRARARDGCTRVWAWSTPRRREGLHHGNRGMRWGCTQDAGLPSRPNSLAARGATSGSGPDDGCRGRFSDPPGAVRRRTRQRRPGGHAPERSGAGLLPVSDAGGSSG